MKILRPVLIWVLAFLLTAASAVYQRMTGPTHPKRGKIEVIDTDIHFKLLRNHNTGKDCPVTIEVADNSLSGSIVWKHYKTDENLKKIPMVRDSSMLSAALPSQPPAGKLEYAILLSDGTNSWEIPGDEPVIIRFKGVVPAYVLFPHILFMFTAMVFAMRVLLATIFNQNHKKITLVTFILFMIGGMILGPIVQKFAFDAYWTGWPFGEDLTDNKTLVAVLAWILAIWFSRSKDGEKKGRFWALGAAIVMFSIYMIPHSMRGSELDYSTLPAEEEAVQVKAVVETDSVLDVTSNP